MVKVATVGELDVNSDTTTNQVEMNGGNVHYCDTKYLVGLHLVTGGSDGDSLGCDEAEIIYMKWTVIRQSDGEKIFSFDSLVRPSDVSKVDLDSVKEKCCIRESDLSVAPDLGRVVEIFHSHLNENLLRDSNNNHIENEHNFPKAVLATDGQLALRQTLLPQASRQNIQLPSLYWSFFDIRHERAKFTDWCLKNTSLSKDGHAKIRNELLTNGSLSDKELNLTSLEDDTMQVDVDTNGNPATDDNSVKGHGTMNNDRHLGKKLTELLAECSDLGYMDCFAEPEAVKSGLEHGICNKDDSVDSNTVIRARGLPWQSSDDDVARFFAGLNIAKGGVALVLSQLGRRNGEALVRFENGEQREMALRRHRHFMGDRYIEVYRATGDDFIKVAAGNSDAAQQFLSLGEAVIIRMRGLPYDCTVEKIIDFFKSGENAISGELNPESDILFVNKIDGKATGDAFVRFGCKGDDVRALAKHKQVIGTRYIELFRSTTAEVQQVLNKTMEPPTKMVTELTAAQGHAVVAAAIAAALPAAQCLITANAAAAAAANLMPQGGGAPLIFGGSRRDCLRLRGLPYEAQVQHILDFLGDFAKHVLLQGVHMVLNAQGHPSGEAFIQLDGESPAASAASERHNKYMQIGKKQRYIEVFQCSADDMNLVLTGPTALQTSLISAANALQTRPIMSPATNLIYPHHAAALSAANLLPATAHFITATQQPLLQQFAGHLTNAGAAGALPALMNGTQRLPVLQNFTAQMVPTTLATPSGTLLYWPYPSPPVSPSSYYAALVAQSQQPVIVLLRGLPLNANVNDVLNLFQGYPDLTADCIQIHRATNGQATGEALVTFPNRFEAERAILEKNRQVLGARPVELYIHGI